MPSPSPAIAIIDCGAGNLHSVRKAFAAVLPATASLSVITEAADVARASHLVLPGVGAFGDCMAGLSALPGMREALYEAAVKGNTPFLGICVGMQMLFQRGHEFGTYEGLGWLEGEICPIAPQDPSLRIPHMGWNRLQRHESTATHPIWNKIEDESFVYFVHSYAATGVALKDVLASVRYGGDIVAMVARDNIVGMQFHPEKSQATGLQLIRNFINM